MYALSAAETISPAIQRTRTFLFRPFRWGTYLKLCLVALITEGFGGNFNFSWPGSHSSSHRHSVFSPFILTPERVAAIVAASVVLIVLSCVLYYLITRLRFAYFHCLIHNTKEIRPGWHLYRAQAIRFFWFSMVVGLCFLMLVVLIALPFAAGFWRLFRDTPVGGGPDPWALLSLVLPLLPIILLLIFAGIAADLILRDFMLPHFALDNATAGEAWAAVRTRVGPEKGTFFVYALLRVILPIVALVALFVVLIIPMIIFLAVIALIEVGIHSALADATGAEAIAAILIQVIVGVVAFGIALFAGICLGGPLSTAIREFALLFYGGRYQRLGDILFPPPAVTPNARGTA